MCQAIPACLAASAGVTPRSVTSKAAWSFSRSVMLHCGGNGGIGSVNVFTGHNRLPHSSRRLCTRSPGIPNRADAVSWASAGPSSLPIFTTQEHRAWVPISGVTPRLVLSRSVTIRRLLPATVTVRAPLGSRLVSACYTGHGWLRRP